MARLSTAVGRVGEDDGAVRTKPTLPAGASLRRNQRPAARARAGVLATALIGLVTTPLGAATILFDASKHEMGGNADWVVDADLFDLNMPAFPCSGTTNESRPARVPTPPAAGITAGTTETYWSGAVSAWAVELVKAGHMVETLPPGAFITYGDGANPQDLSLYDLFIVPEPQNPFTSSEKTAILAFVSGGGGLFMVADHETSDRECDGWDSPHVWNDLTGATSAASGGAFGMWFRVDGSDARPSEDWFDEAVNDNVETAPADPIVRGPFGSGAGGLGLFGATSMDLDAAANPTAKGHVWRNGQAHDNRRVTFATASYGMGRVAAIGDSSPADDGTGDPSDSLHPGWDQAGGGVRNREIHLNACDWLLDPAPDTTPPAPVADLAAIPTSSSSIRLSWTAVGDDGTMGAAAAYDVRMSPGRILTEAQFAAASPLPGEPVPSPVGSAEQLLVGGLAPDTAYYFAMRVSDDASNVSSLSNGDGAVTALPGGGPPPVNHLVISQVQTAGDGADPANDELVEIYNPTGAAVALSGLSLQYKSAAGSTYIAFALPAHTISSHGWYLVARAAYNGSPPPDAVNAAIQMAAAGGNVFLVSGTAPLPSASCSASATIIDKLGYGSGNCAETAAPAAPFLNNSLLRRPGGAAGSGQDTDDNAADFQALAPSAPRNRFSAPATPPSSLGNVGPTLFLAQTPAGAQLDWANAAGASGYRTYRGTSGDFMLSSPAPWSEIAASGVLDPEIPATVFFYMVRATDGASESQD